jgi:hypothetical protein
LLAGLDRRELALGGLDLGLGQPDADQLGGLLLQRHAREQVADPQLDRLGRILVQRLAGALGAAGAARARVEEAAAKAARLTPSVRRVTVWLMISFVSPRWNGPSDGRWRRCSPTLRGSMEAEI